MEKPKKLDGIHKMLPVSVDLFFLRKNAIFSVFFLYTNSASC